MLPKNIDWEEIKRLHTQGASYRELGERFGIKYQTIWSKLRQGQGTQSISKEDKMSRGPNSFSKYVPAGQDAFLHHATQALDSLRQLVGKKQQLVSELQAVEREISQFSFSSPSGMTTPTGAVVNARGLAAVSSSTGRHLSVLGAEPRKNSHGGSRKKIQPDEVDRMVQLKREGKSYREIAKAVGRAPNMVWFHLKKRGMTNLATATQ